MLAESSISCLIFFLSSTIHKHMQAGWQASAAAFAQSLLFFLSRSQSFASSRDIDIESERSFAFCAHCVPVCEVRKKREKTATATAAVAVKVEAEKQFLLRTVLACPNDPRELMLTGRSVPHQTSSSSSSCFVWPCKPL